MVHVLFIVALPHALPHALLIKPDVQAIEREKLASGDSRKCPFCAEIVKREAVVCRYCGRDLPPITTLNSGPQNRKRLQE
jgi:hypothetical protein